MSRTANIIIALAILAVLIVTAFIYWTGLAGPFILDDQDNILRAYVNNFDWVEILYAVTHNNSGVLGRPVSMFSLMITGIVHGPLPWGFKYHNLAIHLINGLLIFWLLLKILSALPLRITEKQILIVAGIAASYWLLHPLMVSTVLYAVQRMAQLSTLFILVALLAYVMARENAAKNKLKFYLLAYALFPAALILSLLSKENGALIPLYIFAIEMIIFSFNYENNIAKKRIITFLCVFVLLPIVLGFYYLLTHFADFTNYSSRDFTMLERLLTQLHIVVVFYPKLIFFPQLSDMTLFHDYFEPVRHLDLLTSALILILITSIFLIFYLRKKAPVLSFALSWYLISHILESSFLNLELIFEHRNYLASMGPILALMYYLFNVKKYPIFKYLSIVILLMMAFLTSTRVQEWKSEDIFYELAITDHPQSLRAQAGVAKYSYDRGDLDKAIHHLELAQQYNPKILGLSLHKILFLCGTGENITELMDETITKTEDAIIATYELNTLDAIMGKVRISGCPELDLYKMLDLLNVAESQNAVSNNQLLLGYMKRFRAQTNIFMGNYIDGVSYYRLAYEYTQLPSLLIELVDFQLRLQKLDDAEQELVRLEKINEQSFGIETARIEILRSRLEEQKAKMQVIDNG